MKKLIVYVTLTLFVGLLHGQQIVEVSGEAIFPGGDESLEKWIAENITISKEIHKAVGSKPYKAVFTVTVDSKGKIQNILPQNKITERDKTIYNHLEEQMTKLPSFEPSSTTSKKIIIYIYGNGNAALYRPNDKYGVKYLARKREENGNCEASRKIDKSNGITMDAQNFNKYTDKADATFTVDETGKVTEILVKCKKNPHFAEFIQKELSEMPRWIPATKGNTPKAQTMKVAYGLNDILGIFDYSSMSVLMR